MHRNRLVKTLLMGLLIGMQLTAINWTSAASTAPEVQISSAWTRIPAPGQDVGASYLSLLSKSDITLVSVETPAAGIVEIHSMTMDNGVMKMRMLDSLPLKAGKTTKLEPGGFHLMLFDLKQTLKMGDSLTFTLNFKDTQGKQTSMTFISPLKAGSN